MTNRRRLASTFADRKDWPRHPLGVLANLGKVTNKPPVVVPARTRLERAVPWIGLAVAVALIAAALLFPRLTGINVHVNSFPPLHAEWMPRFGPSTVAAVILAALAVRYAIDLAARLRWRLLLPVTFASALAWMLALALVDGLSGLGEILDTQYEYLRTARSVTDFGATLREYIAHIPLDSIDNWPVHIAGHPPGALLFFVVLVRIGLGSGLAAGLVVTIVAATTPVAVLLTLRRLGAADAARRAAPFLALGPAAIWMAVSADAMFGAVAAWGLCALAYSACARRRRAVAGWGLLAGALLGYAVMLSYGLPLLGVLAVAVLLIARRAIPLMWAVPAALAVVLAFAAGGFAWWEAYPVLVDRYWAGIASRRPFAYWGWANLAVLAISAGPLVGSSVAMALRGLSELRHGSRSVGIGSRRVVVLLVVAATVMVALADLSGMSKAEVERIWLPFVPWLLVGTALLSERWRRWGLAGQLVFALVVQHLLHTGW